MDAQANPPRPDGYFTDSDEDMPVATMLARRRKHANANQEKLRSVVHEAPVVAASVAVRTVPPPKVAKSPASISHPPKDDGSDTQVFLFLVYGNPITILYFINHFVYYRNRLI
jgi:hypothetical protein